MHAKCFARLQLNKVITNRLNCHKKQYELKLLSSTKSSTHTHTHIHIHMHTYICTSLLSFDVELLNVPIESSSALITFMPWTISWTDFKVKQHSHTLPHPHTHTNTQSTCGTMFIDRPCWQCRTKRHICSVLAMPPIVATVPRTHTLTLTLTLTHRDIHLHWSWGALS